MRYIADGMLGKLTRWLRILGYDVKYSNSLDDDQLSIIAKEERRVLLTRDLELCNKAIAKGIKAIYLKGETPAQRLQELSKISNLALKMGVQNSRCPKCNTEIRLIAKENVADKIRQKTFANYDRFWECPKCAQIYWRGPHWKKIVKTLEEVEERRNL